MITVETNHGLTYIVAMPKQPRSSSDDLDKEERVKTTSRISAERLEIHDRNEGQEICRLTV